MQANIKIYRIFIICIFIFTSMISSAYAEGVRGRLDGSGQYGAYPVPRIPVTLYSPAYQGRTPPVYSDYQGMYYISNVQPGQYVLEIWANETQPFTFNIIINPNQPVTDIAPILAR
jgi:hypothetical protein